MHSENTTADTAIDPWRRMAIVVAAGPPLPASTPYSFQRLVWHRWFLHNSSVFFLQYAGLFLTTLSNPGSLLWFASGTATGFLFLRGKSVLPGIGMGTFLAYAMAGLDAKRAAACAVVWMLQTFFLLKLSYRAGLLSLVFLRRSVFFKYFALSTLVTGCGSALLTLLCFSSLAQTAEAWSVFRNAWLANLNGCLLLGCALFTWDTAVPDFQKWRALSKIQLGLFTSVWLFLCVGLVVSTQGGTLFFFAFSLAWSLLWAAKIYRWYGTLAALFGLALVLSLAAYFNSPLLAQLLPQQVFFLEIFLGVCITAGMLLAMPSIKNQGKKL